MVVRNAILYIYIMVVIKLTYYTAKSDSFN